MLVVVATFASSVFATPSITLLRVPDQGIQPRLVADMQGDIHLLYFKKFSDNRGRNPGALFYRNYVSEEQWSKPVQVSGEFHNSDAVGMASIAVDDKGPDPGLVQLSETVQKPELSPNAAFRAVINIAAQEQKGGVLLQRKFNQVVKR